MASRRKPFKKKSITATEKERGEMSEDQGSKGTEGSAEEQPKTYKVHGEDAPLKPEFVATKREIDLLAEQLHTKINIDPSKFTKAKLKELALAVGGDIFKVCCSSNPLVLNQNRLNNLHLLKEIKDAPERDAERVPYRCWRSNLDRLEQALCAKGYDFLQLNGGKVRENDRRWVRKLVRQCYRPYAVVALIDGCEIKSERATETETLPKIENLTLSVERDWAKLVELAKERHKIKAVHKALVHMAGNGKMEPREVRFQVKQEVLEIEKEREKDLERRRMEQRENVVKAFQHQIERTKSRRDFIDTGLKNIGKNVEDITKGLNGKESTDDPYGIEDSISKFKFTEHMENQDSETLKGFYDDPGGWEKWQYWTIGNILKKRGLDSEEAPRTTSDT